MARKKDLAGLATLAGLAYMATRDKGSKGEAPSSEDAASFAGTPENDSNAGMAPEAGMMEKEPAENFKPTSTASRATPKPVAKPMGGSGRGRQGGATAEELAAYAASKKSAYKTPYDKAREEDRAAGRDFDSLAGSLKDKLTSEDTRKPLPLKSTKSETGNAFMGAGMKKGGSVKGWGIARGARKAKTY